MITAYLKERSKDGYGTTAETYPKSRQSHDATIDRLESAKDTVPIKPSLKTLIVRGIIIVAYLLMGALVFRALEYKKYEDKLFWTRKLRKEIETLITYHNLSMSYIHDLSFLIERSNYEQHHLHKEWDFYQSLYFASTITTTIGYGHITPQSQSGRMFLIIFAIFGIPLNILALASVGEHITVAIFHFLRFVSRKLFNNTKVEHVNIKVMFVSVTLMVFLLLMGGILYCSTEEWTYIDSIYYCFVAMATIGLGDLVPNHGRAPDTQGEKAIWFLRALYLSIGLSLVSTVFTALSNAMEEINLILGRDSTWQPHPPGPGSKSKFHSNAKSASLESEKISYKHKIRKHGNTIMKYKLLKHLKRKRKEENRHQNGWDGLYVDAKRKYNSTRGQHSPLTRSYQTIPGDGSSTRLSFSPTNRTLVKSYSLDTYPKNSLLLIPVISDNESGSTKLSTMSETNSPSFFHKKMNQTLLLPYTDSRRATSEGPGSPTSSYGRRTPNLNHRNVYRNNSEPIRRKTSASSYFNENSGLLLTTSPKMLRVPTPQQTKHLHKIASPSPQKKGNSKFNWTPNILSEIDYDIALNQC